MSAKAKTEMPRTVAEAAWILILESMKTIPHGNTLNVKYHYDIAEQFFAEGKARLAEGAGTTRVMD